MRKIWSGIQKSILRDLVLEAIQEQSQLFFVIEHVQKAASSRDLFPSESECVERGLEYRKYYGSGDLNPIDVMNIQEIMQDLLIERVITSGSDTANADWPRFRITEYGNRVVRGSVPHYSDPSGYIGYLKSLVSSLDGVVEQYVMEGLECYRRRLFSAAAVMFGAAAERCILELLAAIANAHTNPANSKKVKQLIDHPKLGEIFKTIEDVMKNLIDNKIIPYSVHQGSSEHLLSLFEMIRTHRNDSVHPKIVSVDRFRLQLTIDSFPAALERIDRLSQWFSANKSS